MTTTSTGWERLNCPFFEKTCRRVLGSYFEASGFTENARDTVGGLVYRRENVFIEISYEPETFPTYSPTIILGVSRDADPTKWRLTGVPMWFVVPSDRTESKYPSWTFITEDNLVGVLEKIQSCLLEPYAKTLWLDESALCKIINQFQKNR